MFFQNRTAWKNNGQKHISMQMAFACNWTSHCAERTPKYQSKAIRVCKFHTPLCSLVRVTNAGLISQKRHGLVPGPLMSVCSNHWSHSESGSQCVVTFSQALCKCDQSEGLVTPPMRCTYAEALKKVGHCNGDSALLVVRSCRI